MIALDTNFLVYARREETPHHSAARKMLVDLAEGDEPWAIPWPCVYELIRVLTHPRVFDPPSDLDDVLEDLDSLLDSPSLVMLGEGPDHRGHLRRSVAGGRATGNLAHDAHIAALALEHGVRELLTADRDFGRFNGLDVRDPFSE
ncbi:MAG: TA system VapC family ribonuclease toxin [Polyangia bacterium]